MQAVNSENLFKYSKREDRVNTYTHALGAILSVLGMIILLINNSSDPLIIKVGIIIYGISMSALFMASSLYHHEQRPAIRSRLKRLDHAMILVMISGTYAPFCIAIGTMRSYVILLCVYALSGIGILLKVKYINVDKRLSIAIYLIVGWLALFMFKDIMIAFNPMVVIMMVLGGIVYSLGALLYALASFEYHHALWHVFVLVAAILFYIAVFLAL